jgi:predicted small metal-binding protein
MPRKVADCRDMPNTVGCTLMISGEEDEVVRAAAEHAVSVHGEVDTPAMRDEIRASLKDELIPSPVAAPFTADRPIS